MAYRKIVVQGKQYLFKVGRKYVSIRTRAKGGTTHNPTLKDITGFSWSVIKELQQNKGLSITPAHIAEWIKRQGRS